MLTPNEPGVFPVAITPFDENQRIDFESLDRLIDFYASCGARGVTLLGILGEPQKLSEEEALMLVRHVLARAPNSMKVIVGARQASLLTLRAFSQEVMDLGASGVMISPPGTIKHEEQLHAHFEQVTAALGNDTPMVLQDFPRHSGVYISIGTLGKLLGDFPSIRVIKHEEDAGLRKISRLRAMETSGLRRVTIWVGNSGIHLPQELARGADGANTGVGFPEILVEVCRGYAQGAQDRAEDLYDAVLPLIRHEHQPGVGLSIRKEIYRRRGIIRCAKLRAPGPVLDAADHDELTRLLQRCSRRLDQLEALGTLAAKPC